MLVVGARQPAAQNLLQICAGQPVITKRLDVSNGSLYLLLAGAQKLKRTELHGVVLKLRFVDDALVQRQQNIAIVQGAIPCPSTRSRSRAACERMRTASA